MANMQIYPCLGAAVAERHLLLLTEMGRHRSNLGTARSPSPAKPAGPEHGKPDYALGVKVSERGLAVAVSTGNDEAARRNADRGQKDPIVGQREAMDLLLLLSRTAGIGPGVSSSADLWADVIHGLESRQGRLPVAVAVDTCRRLIARLRTGDIDIIIGRIRDADSAAGLNFEALTDKPHRLVVRARHPLLGRDDLRLGDLARLCWIMPPSGSDLRSRLTSMFLSNGVDLPGDTVEAAALPHIARLLAVSDMVVALPAEVASMCVMGGTLATLPFDLHMNMAEYGIFTRKRHEPSACIRALRDMLRDAAGEIERMEMAAPD